ncbi:ATP-binding cassette subfamily F protein 3 [Dyadobacter sp. BE34]|uniref:ATP-binding cassette subfamily F protein 3 n=1 Tax=Dyadobacter fermentans TaxID=94254 RepID=A0ABU1QRG7_9BACT|nr:MULTISPECIES: ABC-F family ATP-binding cassette domain-containing protein [Dyadobacter]MDR6803760.1 ATP-binding cassette subfamily F protein 3 [Dyadobacter fermentans]MDR7041500.1 ATP-binding cassette subfamily F protein 3 [Dyadobacter sp. BE242]MDR7195903.1 ATP-binding cassette subfamily F protein 3 [Dyadobacter sp. BE34]MDR7213552.1 ATP-binding cassette subfamily F protein 3 [Dyadobacter sp. BE31]MDR7261309.1 ATP-binding cassette subfamily F protein 3 [Dyadobacter sp. BE32]
MIAITNLSYFLGDRALYDGASLHIKPKQKIGLIGLNGTGKSTLLRMINGEFQPDGGSISKAGDCTIGFLNQDLLSYQTEDSILSVAMQAFERQNVLQVQMDKILHDMEHNYTDDLVDKLARVQEEFEALDGYSVQSKAEAILEGLGFSTADLNLPLRQFSGGWRMRVMLAKLLLQKPSLLMLDEPTNHLDLPSIQWVEKYTQNYEGAVIVVSHDRQFLDNTIDTTVEVSGGKLNYYAGNYSYYLEEKALRNDIQRGAYENQQAKIRQTERFIERFKAKATKSRQVQSRVKALDRMDMVDEVLDENAKVHFRFQFTTQPGRHVFQLEDASKAYGDKVILDATNISMERGDKIALIGANGRGKSTVLRIVAGTEPIEGKRRLGHNVSFTFYAQHQLESLNVAHNLIEELKYANPTKTETELRTVLGCFLFTGDDVFKKIKVLSGGEKSRVALAKVLLSQANFLLLDEPTNHLDMQSVNILIQALQQYEGSYIVVSHDRYFVENIANKIWYIEDHQIKEYPGTYEEYEIWVEERGLQSAVSEKVQVSSAPPQKNQSAPAQNKNNGKPQSNEDVQKLKKARKKIEELEDTINNLEIRKAETEGKLADPKIYNDSVALAELNRFYADIKQKLEQSTEDWENLMLEVEELSGK